MSRDFKGRYKNIWIIKNDRYYLDKILQTLAYNAYNRQKNPVKSKETNTYRFGYVPSYSNCRKQRKANERIQRGKSRNPWRAIKGMRNTIVHNYGIVDLSVIYDTVTKSIPEFYNQLKKLLIEV